MRKEIFYTAVIIIFLALLWILSFIIGIFLGETYLLLFLITIILGSFFIFIVLYIRIQHNIDRKAILILRELDEIKMDIKRDGRSYDYMIDYFEKAKKLIKKRGNR